MIVVDALPGGGDEIPNFESRCRFDWAQIDGARLDYCQSVRRCVRLVSYLLASCRTTNVLTSECDLVFFSSNSVMMYNKGIVV